MNTRLMLVVPCIVALQSCAQQPVEDPLKNTKKLMAEGHSTLYNNGAFEVPMTTIHLIPAGPDALDLAGEMVGLHATQSFHEALKHAGESAGLAQAGVAKSWAAGKAVHKGTQEAAQTARGVTKLGASGVAAAPGIVTAAAGDSVTSAGKAYTATRDSGAGMAEGSLHAGASASGLTDRAAGGLMAGTVSVAKSTSQGSYTDARQRWARAQGRFIKGYAAVPGKLGQRTGKVADSASLNNFVEAYQRSNEWRTGKSQALTDIVVDTAGSYGSDAKKPFRAAVDEIVNGSQETGYTLATLKSLRWVLQGIFWDATLKPAGKIAGASLGYVTVNAVAFPVIVTVNEGVAVANVAVQVAWNGAAGVYDVTAPTATAAVAGLLSAVELVGGQTLAGGELVAGTAGSGVVYATGKTTAAATAGGGYVAGKTVQYVAAPLVTVGVAAGGTAFGVVEGAAVAGVGTTLVAGGVVGEAGTQVVGNTAAATVVAGGSVVSVTAGAALGTYEMAKAVVVPSGYTLGAGVVVSYGTITQLGAQTVLAVSDASYMVLSMEGPRWVLYAVQGKTVDGEQLPTGAVLDLKAMQQAGETFYRVPASDEEMKRVVESIYGELPVRAPLAAVDK